MLALGSRTCGELDLSGQPEIGSSVEFDGLFSNDRHIIREQLSGNRWYGDHHRVGILACGGEGEQDRCR